MFVSDYLLSCVFQISQLSDEIAKCPKLKVLRVEENCLEVCAFTPQILRNSQIAILAYEGNLFEPKNFHQLEGYDQVCTTNFLLTQLMAR